MRARRIIFGGLVVLVFFFGALWVMGEFGSGPSDTSRPPLVATKPLPPATGVSTIIAPAAIALTAIRDVMEREAPRDLSNTRSNPIGQILSQAEIGWTMQRGPLAVSGANRQLVISTPLNGALRVTGQIAEQASELTNALGSLVQGHIGNEIQKLDKFAGRTFDQRADIKGNVLVTAQPTLQANWRVHPNLRGQVDIANGGLQIGGMRLNVVGEVKPLVDRTVNDQVNKLEQQIRNDPFLEQAARQEWTKMCRSVPLPLADAAPGAPNLWLELRPTKAYAANPVISANAVTLTVGVEAQTRVVASETKPSCPFPGTVQLVKQMSSGRVAVGLPIDIPFPAVNALLEAQLKGRTFPENAADAAATVTVKHATVAASGDRLLISLDVSGRENKSWFGFGADATVHVWGRPVLDRERQILHFADVELAVESADAYGLLGAAARAAIPYLRDAVAEQAVIDLKPLAGSAKKAIAKAIGDFRKNVDGVKVDAAVTDVRLADIAFDAKTLRIIAEADGTVQASVSKLPGY